MIALLVISDGRDEYLQRTLQSAQENLPAFDLFIPVEDREHRLGFAGAIQKGWRRALEAGADGVFHLEQDFTFNNPVDVAGMVDVLDQHPHLVQMALLRQPWNAQERTAGGIVQQHPGSYVPRESGEHRWLEHCRFFTTNPCVIPRWVLERGWPQCEQSEGMFGLQLFSEDPQRRAAFWGHGEEMVEHIGDLRVGVGY